MFENQLLGFILFAICGMFIYLASTIKVENIADGGVLLIQLVVAMIMFILGCGVMFQ